jgi:hypothetical protein
MSVQAKPTPNPNAMKFELPARIFPKPLSFASAQEAAAHPLAAAIFALGGVYNVFMVQNFVTVNKLPDVAWEELLEPIQEQIENHLISNLQSPVFRDWRLEIPNYGDAYVDAGDGGKRKRAARDDGGDGAAV